MVKIELTEKDFKALIRGHVVTKPDVKIVFKEIGIEAMYNALSDAEWDARHKIEKGTHH